MPDASAGFPDQIDWDDARQQLESAGLTDGLPVVPPTRTRVARMLEACSGDPDSMVAVLPPLAARVSYRDIAFNAVMAGCVPACLPVVAAAIQALSAPEFNLIGISTTTGSAAPLLIVNGPRARELHMNCAGNALGPGNRANATIGRAVSLVLRNVGGVRPGELDMATLGQPAKYTCCFAENEVASPWEPLHVERGFELAQSVVTVVGIAGTVEVVDSASRAAADLAQTFARSMTIAGSLGSGGLLGGGEPLLILSPEIAASFARDGCSKQAVKSAIHARARLPVQELAMAVREQLGSRAVSGTGDAAAFVTTAAAASDIMIVVAGGVGVKSIYAPTWAGSTRAVSRVVAAL